MSLAGSLLNQADKIAEKTVGKIYRYQKELVQDYTEEHKKKSIRDVKYHLQYLAEAAANNSVELFLDYISWVEVIMHNIGIDHKNFLQNLKFLQETIAEELGEDTLELDEYFELAENLLNRESYEPVSFVTSDNPLAKYASEYLSYLLSAEKQKALNLIKTLAEDKVEIKQIYSYIFQPVQWEIGRLWQLNRISVAQEHYCTAITQIAMSQIYEYIFSTKKTGNKFLAAAIGSELHEIGVRMVADFFEMAGWDTYFLGANTPKETIISSLHEIKPQILGISTTMTFNLQRVTDLISNIKNRKDMDRIKILVGGYPFNAVNDLWRKVGADGYAPDAEQALELANKLVS